MPRNALNERDLRALRTFREAAFAGGFSAAEQHLHMTKATISRQIKDVEERLGVRLCTRGPQGFELTEAGKMALALAGDALDALDRIMPEMNRVKGFVTGTLSLGLSDNTIGNPMSCVSCALSELQQQAPEVDVSVSIMTTDVMIQALLDRRLDIAVRGISERMISLEYTELFQERQRIYYSPQAHTPADIRTLPLVYRPSHGLVHDALTEHGFQQGPNAVGLEAVATLISTGRCCGMLPVHYADMLAVTMSIEEVPQSPEYIVPFCAVTNPARPLTPSADLLLGLLKAHAASAEEASP